MSDLLITKAVEESTVWGLGNFPAVSRDVVEAEAYYSVTLALVYGSFRPVAVTLRHLVALGVSTPTAATLILAQTKIEGLPN